MNKKMVLAIAAALAAATVFGQDTKPPSNAKTNDVLVIDVEGSKLMFALVDGTSRLPLKFMQAGEDRENRENVRLAPYWIAERMISEGEFAAVMGRKVPEGKSASQAVADVEWIECFEFCERFNERCKAQLPKGFILTMPGMIEWAHAVEVLKGKVSLGGEVGAMLSTANPYGGFLRTMSDRDKAKGWDLAIDLVCTTRHGRSGLIGLRPVLMPLVGSVLGRRWMLMECSVLMREGFYDAAARRIELALKSCCLGEEDTHWATKALEYAKDDDAHEHLMEDWDGLVRTAAAFAERKGFETKPYADGWANRYIEPDEDADIAAVYRKVGIVGEWRRIGDLPEAARKEQPIGESDYILIYGEGKDESFKYEYKVTASNLVQVLKCDFTGDGRGDLVVEDYRATGSGGYCYSFYEGTADGDYRKIDDMQLVGLCALPRKGGKGCGFVVIEKECNPVLSASLVVCKGGKLVSESASSKPFYMLDAAEGSIYTMAPFIGAGYGLGWRHLEGRGVWFRPLYWPWKPGFVWGYDEARREADRAFKLKKDARKKAVDGGKQD